MLSRSLLKRIASHDAALFWVLFCIHGAIAVLYRCFYGIAMEKNSSGHDLYVFMQLLPLDVLRHHLIQGLWNLHSQPPLYNLFCGFFIKLFPSHYLAAMQYCNIGLGSLASAMMYTIGKEVFGKKTPALCVSLFLAFNPALFMYEAYILYDFMCLFLITLSGYFLARYCRDHSIAALIGFSAGMNALILTRSLYNIVLLAPMALLLLPVSGGRTKKALSVFSLFSLPSLSWYVKNAVMFGFFGSSSWMGMNLFKQVGHDLSPQQMIRAGCPAMVIDMGGPLQGPSAYAPFGFTATSAVPSLANDDFNNVNIVAISKVYLDNSLRIIRRFPGHYAKNTLRAYIMFCKPSTRYFSVRYGEGGFVDAIARHVRAWEWLEGRIDWPWWCHWATNEIIFLPLSLIIVCMAFTHKKHSAGLRWSEALRANAALAYIMIVVFFTVLVSSMFELGENNRFKFPVEQFIWVVTIYSIYEPVRLLLSKNRRS